MVLIFCAMDEVAAKYCLCSGTPNRSCEYTNISHISVSNLINFIVEGSLVERETVLSSSLVLLYWAKISAQQDAPQQSLAFAYLHVFPDCDTPIMHSNVKIASAHFNIVSLSDGYVTLHRRVGIFLFFSLYLVILAVVNLDFPVQQTFHLEP